MSKYHIAPAVKPGDLIELQLAWKVQALLYPAERQDLFAGVDVDTIIEAGGVV